MPKSRFKNPSFQILGQMSIIQKYKSQSRWHVLRNKILLRNSNFDFYMTRFKINIVSWFWCTVEAWVTAVHVTLLHVTHITWHFWRHIGWSSQDCHFTIISRMYSKVPLDQPIQCNMSHMTIKGIKFHKFYFYFSVQAS